MCVFSGDVKLRRSCYCSNYVEGGGGITETLSARGEANSEGGMEK